MNEGVQILIERMKTNPEEFVDHHWNGQNKWDRLISSYRSYLAAEDLAVLEETYKKTVAELMQERFTEDVMKELLDPKEETNPYLYSNTANVTLSAGATLGAWSNTAVGTTLTSNSLTLGKTTVTDTQLHELLHLKAQMELERQKLKQKQSKTLFGRLFNYS